MQIWANKGLSEEKSWDCPLVDDATFSLFNFNIYNFNREFSYQLLSGS
jgi:hypothetical protein